MKVFTEVKEVSKKTEVERYKSYNGKLFTDKKMCADYESALTKVNIIAITTSSDCKIVNEYDLYGGYAGSEEYYYLIATVTESTKTSLRMVFRAFHHRSEVGEFEQLEFEKTLKEGSTLVFDLGYLGYCGDISNKVIDTFEDFSFDGTVEEFKKSRLKSFSLLD